MRCEATLRKTAIPTSGLLNVVALTQLTAPHRSQTVADELKKYHSSGERWGTLSCNAAGESAE